MQYPRIYKCHCGKMIYAFDFSDIEDHYKEDDCHFAAAEIIYYHVINMRTGYQKILWKWDDYDTDCTDDLKNKICKN